MYLFIYIHRMLKAILMSAVIKRLEGTWSSRLDNDDINPKRLIIISWRKIKGPNLQYKGGMKSARNFEPKTLYV